MRHAILSAGEFRALYAELRDPQQHVMPDGSGAFHLGYHPLYGPCAIVLDGERFGFVVTSLPAYVIEVPGRPSDPVREGDADWSRLAAFAGMMTHET